MTALSRRSFVAGGVCACAACGVASDAMARISPTAMTPLAGMGFKPTDDDERGLWQVMDRAEEEIASSNLLIRDSVLKDYVGGVMGNLLQERSDELRIYVVRSPEFNALMAPNGMMVVYSGLLTRVRNEAQFAAVLGHESGHYLRRHSVRGWRDKKTKTGIMSFIGVGASIGGAALGSWAVGDLANSLNNALFLSIFAFDRQLEAEADAYGLRLISDANYVPEAASGVWAQIIDERRASATERRKRYRDGSRSIGSTHPPSEERMLDLKLSAAELRRIEQHYDDGRERYFAALGDLRATLLDDQVKLNDPGASLYILGSLAHDGWDGLLRYQEAEVYRLRGDEGDAERAAASLALAVTLPGAPPEAFRAHGYGLLRAGKGEEGRAMLTRYLELDPTAKDAAMVRFTLAQ